MLRTPSENYLIIACRSCKANNRVVTQKAALAICGRCHRALQLFNVRIANGHRIETSNYFMRRVVELTARLRVLRRDYEYETIDMDDAERKLNSCESLTELLYDYASQHQIHLELYSEQLINTVSISHDIADEISRRKKHSKRNRWERSLDAAINITNFVLQLLGFPSFLHPLRDNRRLLTAGHKKRRT